MGMPIEVRMIQSGELNEDLSMCLCSQFESSGQQLYSLGVVDNVALSTTRSRAKYGAARFRLSYRFITRKWSIC